MPHGLWIKNSLPSSSVSHIYKPDKEWMCKNINWVILRILKAAKKRYIKMIYSNLPESHMNVICPV